MSTSLENAFNLVFDFTPPKAEDASEWLSQALKKLEALGVSWQDFDADCHKKGRHPQQWMMDLALWLLIEEVDHDEGEPVTEFCVETWKSCVWLSYLSKVHPLPNTLQRDGLEVWPTTRPIAHSESDWGGLVLPFHVPSLLGCTLQIANHLYLSPHPSYIQSYVQLVEQWSLLYKPQDETPPQIKEDLAHHTVVHFQKIKQTVTYYPNSLSDSQMMSLLQSFARLHPLFCIDEPSFFLDKFKKFYPETFAWVPKSPLDALMRQEHQSLQAHLPSSSIFPSFKRL